MADALAGSCRWSLCPSACSPRSAAAQAEPAATSAADAIGRHARRRQHSPPGAPGTTGWSTSASTTTTTPLDELGRLVLLSEAYRRLGALHGEVSAEEVELARSAGVREDDLEWYAVTAAWRAGDLEGARYRLDALVARNPRWDGAWTMLRDLPPPPPET